MRVFSLLLLGCVAYGANLTSIVPSENGVKLEFDGKISKKEIKTSAHQTFLQLDIAGAKILDPGKFIDINHPLIKKAASFQSDKENAAVRLFVTDDPQKLLEKASFNVEGNSLNFTIKQDSSVAASPVAKPNTKAIAAVSELGKNKFDFKENLKNAAIFCAVLLLFFLFSLGLKRSILKKRVKINSAIHIKTLASKDLSSKHKVELLEIDGERFLIGLGGESINLLTKIEKRFEVKKLAASAPQKTMKQVKTVEKKVAKKPPVKNLNTIDDMRSLIRKKMNELPYGS